MRELCRCSICQDECVDLVRCERGHSICVGCHMSMNENKCPVCRGKMGPPDSMVTRKFAESLDTSFECTTCGRRHPVHAREIHRAWCPMHKFVCPWPSCNHCACAKDMEGHVRADHPSALKLFPDAEWGYHVVFAADSGQFVMCVGETVVVLSLQPRFFLGMTDASICHCVVRAYYTGAEAHPLRCTIRQLQIERCDVADDYTDEHHIPIVPPLLASREHVVTSNVLTVVSPRNCIESGRWEETPFLVLPNARPGKIDGIQEAMERVGVRPAPIVPSAVASPVKPIYVLHVKMHYDLESKISDVYRS